MSHQPTLRGVHVENETQALQVFSAVIRGDLPRFEGRLEPDERRDIRPGDVYVWRTRHPGRDENAVARWTDGIKWSQSRAVGEFLFYSRDVPNSSPTSMFTNTPLTTQQQGMVGAGNDSLHRHQTRPPNITMKKNMSVFVKDGVSGEPRKWSLASYLSDEAIPTLKSINAIHGVGDVEPLRDTFSSVKTNNKSRRRSMRTNLYANEDNDDSPLTYAPISFAGSRSRVAGPSGGPGGSAGLPPTSPHPHTPNHPGSPTYLQRHQPTHPCSFPPPHTPHHSSVIPASAFGVRERYPSMGSSNQSPPISPASSRSHRDALTDSAPLPPLRAPRPSVTLRRSGTDDEVLRRFGCSPLRPSAASLSETTPRRGRPRADSTEYRWNHGETGRYAYSSEGSTTPSRTGSPDPLHVFTPPNGSYPVNF